MGDGAKARRVYEDAVEYLCRNVEAVRELVGPGPWEASFAVVRDGDPSAGEWRDAVRALHNAAEEAGVPGGLGLRSTMGVGEWPAGPTPRSAGWVCPTGRCARVDLRMGAGAPDTPTCSLAGRPMHLVGG
ncbi:hypothetical protein [Streptomyces sp. NBC_00038]|uniref:hypothetical protein n=1 Tax=Streptomyces sp. NBC_00038 TaxID=2903615 RepID=UPI00224EF98E|nr:hypothetical protein [Streptomyces sp. NBC_00038]MCX5563148.1 hypothetical protein [Streptomyces sp. NBC_00038]